MRQKWLGGLPRVLAAHPAPEILTCSVVPDASDWISSLPPNSRTRSLIPASPTHAFPCDSRKLCKRSSEKPRPLSLTCSIISPTCSVKPMQTAEHLECDGRSSTLPAGLGRAQDRHCPTAGQCRLKHQTAHESHCVSKTLRRTIEQQKRSLLRRGDVDAASTIGPDFAQRFIRESIQIVRELQEIRHSVSYRAEGGKTHLDRGESLPRAVVQVPRNSATLFVLHCHEVDRQVTQFFFGSFAHLYFGRQVCQCVRQVPRPLVHALL